MTRNAVGLQKRPIKIYQKPDSPLTTAAVDIALAHGNSLH